MFISAVFLCLWPGELGEKGYPHSPNPENDSLLEFGNQEDLGINPINPWDRFAAEVGIRTPSEEGSPTHFLLGAALLPVCQFSGKGAQPWLCGEPPRGSSQRVLFPVTQGQALSAPKAFLK